MKTSPPFRFKQFSVSHSRSSMKVGVDAVLTGALAPVDGARRILDVGCGCGVISLMLAQRVPEAYITAIDIHPDSVDEARENFIASPWTQRLGAEVCDYAELVETAATHDSPAVCYDAIVSNPPYFRSGVDTPETPREQARHQAGLSPERLVRTARHLLNPGGTLTLICPPDFRNELTTAARESGMQVSRIVCVQGHPEAPVKRIVMTFQRPDEDDTEKPATVEESLVLETTPGSPTDAHRRLCRDFYLRF